MQDNAIKIVFILVKNSFELPWWFLPCDLALGFISAVVVWGFVCCIVNHWTPAVCHGWEKYSVFVFSRKRSETRMSEILVLLKKHILETFPLLFSHMSKPGGLWVTSSCTISKRLWHTDSSKEFPGEFTVFLKKNELEIKSNWNQKLADYYSYLQTQWLSTWIQTHNFQVELPLYHW